MADRIITFQYARDNYDAYKKQIIPASNECMTKADVNTYLNADMSVLSSYANNQLVPRTKISTNINSIPLYFNLINDNLYSCTATINSNQILTLINNGSTNTQLNNNDYFYVTYKNDSLNEQQIRIIINSSIRGELLNMLTFISSKEHVGWSSIQAKSGESLTVSITVYTW